MNWIQDHWQQISSALASVVLTARLIIKLLPNPKAGTYLEQFVTLLKHLGLHIDPAGDAAPATTTVVVNPPPAEEAPKPTILRAGLWMLIGFLCLPALTACQSTPNRIAANATSVVATSANIAVRGWWDYKQQFPAGYTAAQDAQVHALYTEYQAVMKLESDAYEAYLANPTNAPPWQAALSVAAATEAKLVSFITQLKTKNK